MRTSDGVRTERCRPTLEKAAGLPADLLDLLAFQDGDATPAAAALDWLRRETEERSADSTRAGPRRARSGSAR